MIRLYDREECPDCRRVRRALARYALKYELVEVPRQHSQRAAVMPVDRLSSAHVPVLEDGDTLVQGADEILAWLEERHRPNWHGEPVYGLTRRLPGMDYEQAVEATRTALAGEGFGVLTEIDVKATLKKKLDADFRPYVILGACNPPLAHRALTAEPPIGLLLPCNVVVTVDDDGVPVVSAIDPKVMFKVVGRDEIEPIALEVREKLVRVLDAIQA